MALTIEEVAQRLQDAHEALMIMAESFRATAANPNGGARAQFTTKDGTDTFSLRDLADDLRANQR